MGSHHCANCKSNCCVHEYGGTFVTIQEAERIATALGMQIDDVCAFVEDNGLKDEKDYNNFFNLRVEFNGKILPLVYKKHILILKKKQKKWACPFLNEKGCRIPDIRPAYCHVFPFWFKVVNDKVVLFPMNAPTKDMETCLVRKAHFNDRTHELMLKDIGETKPGLLKILQRYVEEIKQYQDYAPLLYGGMLPSEAAERLRREKHL
ncbi:MAG: YkgJ family cysteine cluster protein [Candidatus Woesearchaeota archaeon]